GVFAGGVQDACGDGVFAGEQSLFGADFDDLAGAVDDDSADVSAEERLGDQAWVDGLSGCGLAVSGDEGAGSGEFVGEAGAGGVGPGVGVDDVAGGEHEGGLGEAVVEGVVVDHDVGAYAGRAAGGGGVGVGGV